MANLCVLVWVRRPRLVLRRLNVPALGQSPCSRRRPFYHHNMPQAAPAVRPRRNLLALAVSLLISAAFCAPDVLADDYTDRANKSYGDIPANRRSDTVLIPLLLKLEPAPPALKKQYAATMLLTDMTGWAEAAKWAAGAPQQEAIKSLASVTQEKDWRKAFGFGQPYGLDGVDLPLIQAGAYTDLGDPPTLAAAKVGYLPLLDSLMILVNVEATRLTSEGKVNEAIDLLTNGLFFARQIAERQLHVEMMWGMTQMHSLAERVRDVVYLDSLSANKLDTTKLLEQIKRLDDRSNAYLDLLRVKFPVGDRAAAEQLVARIYSSGNLVDPQVFASTMSRLTSTTRPLRLFSESGKWRSVGSSQAAKAEAITQTGAIFADWETRWNIPLFDRRLTNLSAYQTMDNSRFASLHAIVPDASTAYGLRVLTRVELIGTRHALAVMGHRKNIGQFPPQLSSVRPGFLKEIEADPFNRDTANGQKPPLGYFVPVRDTEFINGKGNPHDMKIVVLGRPFDRRFQEETFIMYSVGSDNAGNNAKRLQNTFDVVQGADYLIWPPVLSLARQHLIDEGELK